MGNPEIWKKFWLDLYNVMVAAGYTPKWKPEDMKPGREVKSDG
jgi:hypothetical protein